MLNIKNVNYGMDIEKVHINFLTYERDTLLKRGNQISWSSIKEDKKHVGDNTITYLAEVNNGYKKEVTFKLVQVTTKLTNDDNVRRQYTEIVMEDIDGEFGKIICNTNDVKKATKTLKNKMSVEYRKTLEKRAKDTKELKNENELLNKRINEKEQIERKLREHNAQDKLEITLLKSDKVLLEGKVENLGEQVENQLMVIEKQKNEIVELNKTIDILKDVKKGKRLNKMVARALVRKIVTMYNKGTSIDKLVDMLIEFLEK